MITQHTDTLRLWKCNDCGREGYVSTSITTPSCPYCNSTNVERVSQAQKKSAPSQYEAIRVTDCSAVPVSGPISTVADNPRKETSEKLAPVIDMTEWVENKKWR